MDFQQPHPYNRPPPPPPPQQPPLPPPHSTRPPVPPPPTGGGSTWYSTSNQFQYHPPAPPPPAPAQQQQQWGPPLPPPPPPYYQQSQYPPPPPLPPVPPRRPHSFPHGNQDWGNMSWGQQQSWGNSAQSNEDWAAKARAWAAAKTADDHQHQYSQFMHDGRPEEHSYYEQYTQSANQHFQDTQPPPVHPSSNQHIVNPVPLPQTASFGHAQDPAFFSSGQSHYAPDRCLPYTARDGNFTGDSVSSFPQQGSSSISPLVHQQEVPSSYSSIAGKEETMKSSEMFYGSSPLHVNSSQQHHAQLMPTAPNKPAVMEEHNYGMGPDLSDQPLDFAPRYSHEHDQHSQPYYMRPSPPGGTYPPLPPVPPVGSQVDPSPIPDHTAPLFGGVQSSSFHPTVPSVGAHFAIGAGATLHPPAAFPTDAFAVSDRPKKAAVPNWLREEIIKKKAVITTSAPDLPKEDSQSIEDEGVDRSYRKGDQADSKSIDSSRSTEEEDDEEVELEAARTAAMNQEIKRVLTEVLLKVTDELFDEIATKVLTEEDLTVNVTQQADASSQKVSASVIVDPTPKASAKFLVPLKSKEAQPVDASEKSTSSSPGDLLGLASYASDDEDDSEIQSPEKQNPKDIESVERDESPVNLTTHKASSITGGVSYVAVVSKLTDDRTTRNSAHEDTGEPLKTELRAPDDKMLTEKDALKTEKPSETLDLKRTKIDNSSSEYRRDKSDKSSKSEVGKGFGANDNGMDIKSTKERKPEKEQRNRGNHEERHVRKEKADDLDGSKNRVKERSRKSGEKDRESDSRKRPSPSDVKEERKEIERDSRSGVITDNGRKRERSKDENREKSRHKEERGSSRRKKHRSSSVDSRGKEDGFVKHADGSSEGSSDDSRRKVRPSRHRSPSPIRSRKRQVSRSPHSKHSQRRHSPYPASERTRGRRSRSRSRSRSPVRRKR